MSRCAHRLCMSRLRRQILSRTKLQLVGVIELAHGHSGLLVETRGACQTLGIDMEPDDLVSRFSPMTLCGLALTGANNHHNVEGAMPGIITGEEISSLDLSRCEMAVLSACETNVGIRISGMSANRIEKQMRLNAPPVIGRIEEDAFIIDLRTVLDDDLPVICRGVQNILNKE